MFLVAYYQNDWVLLREDLELLEALSIMRSVSNYCVQIGIWYSRKEWLDYRPCYLIDNRDKSGWSIRGLEGLINSLDSSWF